MPKATSINFIQGTGVYSADEREKSEHKPDSVKASKEVIISGGTFNSPQILKVSGVGAREDLESFGIDVVVDLPRIGTNMQDRYEVSVAAQASKDFAHLKGCRSKGHRP
jgi:choline dehydrogenase